MLIRKTLIAAIAVSGLALAACDIDQTEEGEMPEVDVSGDPGNLPEYEVRKTEEGRAPDLDVDTRGGNLPEYDVDGPEVDVETEERTVRVPSEVEVTFPDDDEDGDGSGTP